MSRMKYTNIAKEYDEKRFIDGKGSFVLRTDQDILQRVFRKFIAPLVDKSLMALDLPVGTGRALPYLQSENVKIVGCDLTHEMLEVAKTRMHSHSLGLVQGDSSLLPFKDDTIDLIVSLRFFHLFHPSQRAPLTREFNRVVKPGGFVFCSFTNEWHGFLVNWLKKKVGALKVEFMGSGEPESLFPGWTVVALYGNYVPFQYRLGKLLGPRGEDILRWFVQRFPMNRFCFERFYILQKSLNRKENS